MVAGGANAPPCNGVFRVVSGNTARDKARLHYNYFQKLRSAKLSATPILIRLLATTRYPTPIAE